jgi:uncharacterized protein YecE (DUF72 family)
MQPIRIGTCGWSYDDWKGVFYPKGATPAQYLAYVAERFPIVEVDSPFYQTPRPSMVEGWRDRTPAEFRFSLKVPQSITHEKLLLDCQPEVEGFLASARLLGDKLACCLLQFAYFNRKLFASLDAFLERLQPFLGSKTGQVSLRHTLPGFGKRHRDRTRLSRQESLHGRPLKQTIRPVPINWPPQRMNRHEPTGPSGRLGCPTISV